MDLKERESTYSVRNTTKHQHYSKNCSILPEIDWVRPNVLLLPLVSSGVEVDGRS